MTIHMLESTGSICPLCLQVVPASIITDGKKVCMQKYCPSHGRFESLIWSSLNLYKSSSKFSKPPTLPLARESLEMRDGCPYDCGLCPEHNQHTCLAIVEVTQKCNLCCPVCLASSPYASPDIDGEQLQHMLKALVRYEGQPTPIQLSGGEPTMRKDLVELVQIAVDLGFRLIEIDTNGIELARNPLLARNLADVGLSGVYLQFDGVDDGVHEKVRGSLLLSVKEKAIENAQKAGLAVVFAATIIKGVNDHQLWDIVRYALNRKALGVNFQTLAASGRFPNNFFDPMDRVTVPDIKTGLESQSGGKIRSEDFTPIPSLKHCGELSYLAILNNEITSINRLVNSESLLDYYDKLSGFSEIIEAVDNACTTACYFPGQADACCSAHPSSLTDLFKGQYFSIGIHSPQDIWTADLGRWKRCCVQELTPDGKLIPFCLYNITSLNGKTIYRSVNANCG